MRLLVDTHALAWWYLADPRLSAPARAAMLDKQNDVLVSPISAWEIATKYRSGKWPEAAQLATGFRDLVNADGFGRLPLNEVHALHAGRFPQPHRDPFDRMLAAQCEIEGLTLVTRDPVFTAFGCRTIW